MKARGVLAAALSLVSTAAAGGPLVELKTTERSYFGRVVGKDDAVAVLIDRDGSLNRVPLAEVTAYSVASDAFRPYTSVDLRDRLLRVVGGGRGADAVATPHYVVVGRPGAARAVGEALEEVYAGYRWYCSTRGLDTAPPEFPLVGIVFPDRATFDAYCRAEGVPPASSLRGYYRDATNRFVCYEAGGDVIDGRVAGELKGTLVHEAIHQVAFNTGLHARGAELPVWVAEGFATALEPEAARRPLRSDGRPLDRANVGRLERFLAGVDRGDGLKPSDLVAGDEAFRRAPLDAYAAAWALTFYLMEAKPSAYGRYLRAVARRDPLAGYSAEERAADFNAAFGGDRAMLDAEVVRFSKRVAAGERR